MREHVPSEGHLTRWHCGRVYALLAPVLVLVLQKRQQAATWGGQRDVRNLQLSQGWIDWTLRSAGPWRDRSFWSSLTPKRASLGLGLSKKTLEDRTHEAGRGLAQAFDTNNTKVVWESWHRLKNMHIRIVSRHWKSSLLWLSLLVVFLLWNMAILTDGRFLRLSWSPEIAKNALCFSAEGAPIWELVILTSWVVSPVQSISSCCLWSKWLEPVLSEKVYFRLFAQPGPFPTCGCQGTHCKEKQRTAQMRCRFVKQKWDGFEPNFNSAVVPFPTKRPCIIYWGLQTNLVGESSSTIPRHCAWHALKTQTKNASACSLNIVVPPFLHQFHSFSFIGLSPFQHIQKHRQGAVNCVNPPAEVWPHECTGDDLLIFSAHVFMRMQEKVGPTWEVGHDLKKRLGTYLGCLVLPYDKENSQMWKEDYEKIDQSFSSIASL